MKLEFEKNIIESSGLDQSIDYSIGNAAVIFDILRSKMYSDPIGSICREIACNARDAHREIGTPDKPIKITLPTFLEPYFIIQDFGPGMDPNRIKIFTSFGDSTKRESNILTGGFGLGGKTPFSYVDNFTIITIVNGIKYKYLTFIDDSRLGKTSLLEQESTTEPNGTSIVIPVQNKDFQAFTDAIAQSTLHWNPKPMFDNNKQISNYYNHNSDDKYAVTFQGSDWKIFARNGYYDKVIQKVLIDSIEYPLNKDFLDDLTPGQEALLKNHLRIYCDNGVLSLSSSRETIHYDDKTQTYLKDKLTEILDSIRIGFQQDINKCSSYLEAVNHYFTVYQSFSSYPRGNILIDFVPEFNGEKINSEIILSDLDVKEYNIKKYHIYHDRILSEKSKLILKEPKNNLFVLHDLPSEYNRNVKIRQIISEKNWGNYNVQVISFNTPEDLNAAYQNDKFKKLLNLLEVITLSSVILPARPKIIKDKSNRPKKQFKIYQFTGRNTESFKMAFRELENLDVDDFIDTITQSQEDCYLLYKLDNSEINQGLYFPNLGEIQYNHLYSLFEIFDKTKFFLVKEKDYKKISSHFSLNILDKIQEKFDEAVKNPYVHLTDDFAKYIFSDNFSSLRLKENDFINSGLLSNNIFSEYLNECIKYNDSNFDSLRYKIQSLFSLVEKNNWLDLTPYQILNNQKSSKLSDYFKSIKSKYPLLSHIKFDYSYYNSISDTEKVKLINDYINLVELQNKI